MRRLALATALLTLAACNPPASTDVAVSGVVPSTTTTVDPRAQGVGERPVRAARPAPTTTTTTTVAPTTTTTAAPPTTTTAPPVVPAAASEPAPYSDGGVWDRLAQCESNGNWHINTGNGYFGGLQFSLRSWQWVGGTGYPHEHSRATQIAMAERLLERQGWGAWPACSKRLGLR